jgi:hypothetical protein
VLVHLHLSLRIRQRMCYHSDRSARCLVIAATATFVIPGNRKRHVDPPSKASGPPPTICPSPSSSICVALCPGASNPSARGCAHAMKLLRLRARHVRVHLQTSISQYAPRWLSKRFHTKIKPKYLQTAWPTGHWNLRLPCVTSETAEVGMLYKSITDVVILTECLRFEEPDLDMLLLLLLLLLQETLDRKPSPKNSVAGAGPRTGDNANLHIFKHPRLPSLNTQTALQVNSTTDPIVNAAEH